MLDDVKRCKGLPVFSQDLMQVASDGHHGSQPLCDAVCPRPFLRAQLFLERVDMLQQNSGKGPDSGAHLQAWHMLLSNCHCSATVMFKKAELLPVQLVRSQPKELHKVCSLLRQQASL